MVELNAEGYDLGWFATDRDGHIGFFTSQGSEVVPASVLASKERWELLDRGIHKLPSIGKGSLRWFVTGNREDWIEMARRGLYAYDFSEHYPGKAARGHYKRISSPSRPVGISSLALDLQQALSFTVISTVCFARQRTINPGVVLAHS
jgi:hypothetical protein